MPHPHLFLAVPLSLALIVATPVGAVPFAGVPFADPTPADVTGADAQDDGEVVRGDAGDDERREGEVDDRDVQLEPGPTVGQRVHIIVDRRTTVQGTIELEDEEVIVVRTREELKSLPKGRVLRIVRLVEPGDGHPGIVFLHDGRVRRGTILEDGFDSVILSIEGIRTVLPRADVDFVELEPTFEERLALFRESIGPHDHVRRLELARWLMSEREYELAHLELVTIQRNTEMPEARRLLGLVEAQLALNERGRSESAADDRGTSVGTSPDRRGERAALPSRLLTADDVNIIRVYELDLNRAPRLTVEPETINRLVEQHGTSDLIPTGAGRTALLRAESVDIARLMFQLRARELYPEIKVHGDPQHLNLFRQRVHNAWLIPTCATSRCHGGPDGGSFFLHNENHKDERVRYTNLLILDQTRINGRPLIDYEEPAMSLIIQYALPRQHARLPHPDVRGWRPVLTDGNRRVLEDTIAWIRSMHVPRPDYPVDYEPPVIEASGIGHDPREPSGFTVPRRDGQDR